MKYIKLILLLSVVLLMLNGCAAQEAGVSRHPIIKERVDMMATEVRVSIFVADNIDTPRLGNYNLRKGNNYLRVPVGDHILYWSKKGESFRKSIKVSDENRRFGIF